MKKLIAVLLACGMLIGLVGCKGTGKSGTLTVAVFPDCAPYIQANGDGTYSGIEIELIRVICDELCVLPDIQAVAPDAILSGVEHGKYGLGAGMLSSQAETGATVVYTNPYASVPLRLLAPSDTTMTDVNYLARNTIAVCRGSFAENHCVRNGIPVAVYDTHAAALEAVLSGRADGLITDEIIAEALLQTHSDRSLILIPGTVATATYAFALAEEDRETLDRINLALGKLLTDGTMHAIYREYGVAYTSPNG